MADEESFNKINEWLESFKNNNSKEDYIPYLVGTKNDLKFTFDQSLIEEFSQKNNIPFMSTSAKKNNNIDELFEEIGKELYFKFLEKGDLPQKNFKIKHKKNKKRNICCNINMFEGELIVKK